jgi:quercetin dioxygenase-like cupin family protein
MTSGFIERIHYTADGRRVPARVCAVRPNPAESRSMVRPLTTAPDESPRVRWRDGVESRLHGDGASSLTVLEQWSAAGTGAPQHRHGTEELILVVGGNAEVWIDGAVHAIGDGGSILIPAHSWHGYRNAGSGELHTLAFFPSARPTVEYEREPGRVYEIAERHRRGDDAP